MDVVRFISCLVTALVGAYVSVYLLLGNAVVGIVEAAKLTPTDAPAIRFHVFVIVVLVPLVSLMFYLMVWGLSVLFDPGRPRRSRHANMTSRQVERNLQQVQRQGPR